MNIKVSVIIPVYNAEKYLPQCIESLLCQTLQECEFIFVNDGSEDQSKEIIEKYTKIDSRIRIINQVNSGVSTARNVGIKIAKGEYIGFVDADDYVEKDMFETLYNTARISDCDMIISNFESTSMGKSLHILYPFPKDKVLYRDYILNDLLKYFLKEDNLNSIWNKVFRNKLIKEHHVIFPEGVSLGEDVIFNIQFLTYAKKVKVINYCGYHYREVEGSATRNILEKDYFNRTLEVFHSDLPEIYKQIMNTDQIDLLKSRKLIKSVIAFIHVYLAPSNDLKLFRRFGYVKNMVKNPTVRKVIEKYHDILFAEFGRYEKFIINMILKESLLGLYIATAYSRYRNRKAGEVIG